MKCTLCNTEINESSTPFEVFQRDPETEDMKGTRVCGRCFTLIKISEDIQYIKNSVMIPGGRKDEYN